MRGAGAQLAVPALARRARPARPRATRRAGAAARHRGGRQRAQRARSGEPVRLQRRGRGVHGQRRARTLGSFLGWLDARRARPTTSARAASRPSAASCSCSPSTGRRASSGTSSRFRGWSRASCRHSARGRRLGGVRRTALRVPRRRGRAAVLRLARRCRPSRSSTTNLEAFKVELAERSSREERRLAYVALTRAQERAAADRVVLGRRHERRSSRAPTCASSPRAASSTRALPRRRELEENPADRAGAHARVAVRSARHASAPVSSARRMPCARPPRERRRRRGARDAVAARHRPAARRTRRSRSSREPRRAPEAHPGVAVQGLRRPTRRRSPTALRRPMPERPYRATRLGTLFHSWVEQRIGGGRAARPPRRRRLD